MIFIAFIIASLALATIETWLLQWLLGVFGFNFDFFTVMGILLVIDLLFLSRRK